MITCVSLANLLFNRATVNLPSQRRIRAWFIAHLGSCRVFYFFPPLCALCFVSVSRDADACAFRHTARHNCYLSFTSRVKAVRSKLLEHFIPSLLFIDARRMCVHMVLCTSSYIAKENGCKAENLRRKKSSSPVFISNFFSRGKILTSVTKYML